MENQKIEFINPEMDNADFMFCANIALHKIKEKLNKYENKMRYILYGMTIPTILILLFASISIYLGITNQVVPSIMIGYIVLNVVFLSTLVVAFFFMRHWYVYWSDSVMYDLKTMIDFVRKEKEDNGLFRIIFETRSVDSRNRLHTYSTNVRLISTIKAINKILLEKEVVKKNEKQLLPVDKKQTVS